MYARQTLLEIDTMRIDMDAAVEMFRREVMPELERQPGFAGVMVLTTPQGTGAVISFWETADAAETASSSGFYPTVLERYTTIYKAPPGRERYEVALARFPAVATG